MAPDRSDRTVTTVSPERQPRRRTRPDGRPPDALLPVPAEWAAPAASSIDKPCHYSNTRTDLSISGTCPGGPQSIPLTVVAWRQLT